MAENEKTSAEVGSIASRLLKDPNSSEDEKKVAASCLTQRPGITNNEKTSPEICSIAARLLRDPGSSEDVKKVAGSVLTQCPDHK